MVSRLIEPTIRRPYKQTVSPMPRVQPHNTGLRERLRFGCPGSRSASVWFAGMRLVLATSCALACSFAVSVPSRSEGAAVEPTPISVKHATAPFLARGYRLVPNLSSDQPQGIVARYEIYPSNPRVFISVAELQIYKDTRRAKRVIATGWVQAPYVYRVANVVLDADLVRSDAPPQKLLSALRKLGVPLRLY